MVLDAVSQQNKTKFTRLSQTQCEQPAIAAMDPKKQRQAKQNHRLDSNDRNRKGNHRAPLRKQHVKIDSGANVPPSTYFECIERANKSYEEYERERKELLEKPESGVKLP